MTSRRLVAQAHAVGALTYVDGVHYAAHFMPDVRAWDATSLPARPTSSTARTWGSCGARRALLEGLDAPKLAPGQRQCA